MTNRLNNSAYNHALKMLHFPAINLQSRITRKTVFEAYPCLSEIQKEQIVKLKQRYFMENMNLTQPNMKLISFLQSKNSSHCVLWTSADKDRVRELLAYHKLSDRFALIFYSNKLDVDEDTKKICEIFNCLSKQLSFFEDDKNVVNKLRSLGQRVFTERDMI